MGFEPTLLQGLGRAKGLAGLDMEEIAQNMIDPLQQQRLRLCTEDRAPGQGEIA